MFLNEHFHMALVGTQGWFVDACKPFFFQNSSGRIENLELSIKKVKRLYVEFHLQNSMFFYIVVNIIMPSTTDVREILYTQFVSAYYTLWSVFTI